MPKVFVVLLNWNGFQDTIECLESILDGTFREHRLVVIDNDSTDDSCQQLRAWSAKRGLHCVEYTRAQAEAGGVPALEAELGSAPAGKGLVLVHAGENLGFAGGNNIGLRYSLARGADYALLLNNDTVADPRALAHLTGFLDSHPEFQAATCQIRSHRDSTSVWNCGGDLTWYGARRYHYAGAKTSAVPQRGHRRVTFATGCVLMLRAGLLRSAGLLTTRFFFGEEDFELALRLKSLGAAMACDYEAVVYHKVSRSIKRAAQADLGLTYIHYLNRFIDIRCHWPEPIWRVWRLAYLPYVALLTWRASHPPLGVLVRFLKSLMRESSSRQSVDRETFQTVMRQGYLTSAAVR